MRSAPELLSEISLRSIWDDRSRHGVDLVKKFKGSRSKHGGELLHIKKRRKMRKFAKERRRAALALGSKTKGLDKKLRKATRRLDEVVSTYLQAIQLSLLEPTFRLRVTSGPAVLVPVKPTYRLKSVGFDVTFFASRILQHDISTAFELRQTGRTELVRALRSAVEGPWPKTIVRADVASFYESVPHDQLLAMVDSNPNLSSLSKKWIHQIVESFGALSVPRSRVGLPRGVGPSAPLAEAYLSQFDQIFSNRKECVYYARYVDDVVAVMAPTEDHDAPKAGYLALMKDALSSIGLSLSSDPAKVSEQTLRKGSAVTHGSVDILGYSVRHDAANGAVVTDFSLKRLRRIYARIDRTFDVYERSHSKHGQSAKLLELRVRFLTSNTRLINSKRDAFVGIKFSNPLITRTNGLQSLDRLLTRWIAKLAAGGTAAGVVDRLRKHGFRAGFDEVRYVRFSDLEWRQITSAWRDLV